MVNPRSADLVRKALEEHQLDWKVLISDVGRALSPAEKKTGQPGVSSRSAPGTSDSPRYLRYKEVNEFLDDLAKRFPKMVTVKTIGKSSEGRDLRVITISSSKTLGDDGGDIDPTDVEDKDKQDKQEQDREGRAKKKNRKGKAKPGIFIDAGIHAREWIAPATALYIIHQLVENATHTAKLTNDVDWHILPLMNPDGYEYCHTTDRLWRKTRSKTWWGLGCAGADANRNFDFHWREVGASWSSCSFTYAGSKPFSEPESRAVRDYLLANKEQLKMYLTYHSYGNFLLYPWGYTNTLPSDWKTLDALAKKANAAMVAAGSEPYTIGSSTNVLYAAAGGSDDWAKGVAGIPLSYTIELPGGNGHGFDLPASYIPEVGRHQMHLITVFAKYVGAMKQGQNKE
ncbi:carboxypeptidase B-like [Thrips palmi]|uniref:Carboxypeptidase B-like n=1 Tax=Thrips palmi TaxID=161013 RepID=A0A6P9AAP0_THRPL|nr:carboxypeptidase B-like [Thrips palmi]